jgi:hypothetical protein
MNVESRSVIAAVYTPTAGLDKLLTANGLAAAARPPTTYSGAAGRLIVPTVRTTLEKGSPLRVRALGLAASGTCLSVTVTVMPLGARARVVARGAAAAHHSQGLSAVTAASKVSLKQVARAVFEGDIPPQAGDFE